MADWKQPLDRTAGTLRSIGRQVGRAGRGAGSLVWGGISAAANCRPDPKDLNNETLKAKVESEIIRPQDAPKSSVNGRSKMGTEELRRVIVRAR